MAGAVLAGLGALAGYGAALPQLVAGWQWLFDRARVWLGLRVMLGEQEVGLPFGFRLVLPELSAVTPQPGEQTLILTALITGAMLAGSFVLPQRATPIRSLLRLLAVVQASAIAFFVFQPEPFPYRLSDYLFGLLSTGLAAIGAVPLVLGLTLYPLDLSWARKAAVTAGLMVHFAVLTPLLVLLHAAVILAGTALLMPVLFVGGAVLVYGMVFLAGYGWAVSGSRSGSGEVPAPVHSQ